MDSINVMTSLVGLLGSAGKVVVLLLAVKKSISEAPQMMDQMISQVRELELSLSAVQSFLLGISSAPRGRISMIRVEQLVAILTEAVLTFSELEALVTSIAKDKGRLPIMSRLMSLWKEDVVANIMLRLERHKSSLSLMLNIAQCESNVEAEQSRETLQSLVEQLLRSNHDILMRLESIEENFETRSVLTNCFRNGTMPNIPDDELEAEQVSQSKLNPAEVSAMGSSFVTQDYAVDQIGFQVDLGTSRVYRRTERYKSDVSFASSAVRTHAWSIFSGLSLSEVSVISVIALPLYLDEIYNREWYTLRGIDHSIPEETGQEMLKSSLVDPLAESSSDAAANIPSRASQSNNEPGLEKLLQDSIPSLPPNSLKNPPKPPSQGAARLRKMVLYKLVVLGDGGVGKTDFITAFSGGFVESYEGTLRKQVVIDGQACMLEVLDTAGQEEYTALRDQWIRDGEAFVLIYSISSRSSFTRIQRFHSQITRVKESTASPPAYPGSPISAASYYPIPIMLVGNNCDRVTEREISTQEGHALAREFGCEFVEASAKNCINVEKAFYDVVRILRRQRMQTALRVRKPPLRKENASRAFSLSDIVRREDRSRRP